MAKDVTFSSCYFQMYESTTSGAVKQTGAIFQQPAAGPGVIFQAASSVAAAGQYVTMVSLSQ